VKTGKVSAKDADDRELIAEAKRGDKSAFEGLVRMYSKYIYTTAFFILRDPHEAEDVSQEVFVKVYLSIGGFRGLSSFKTWIRKLTVNTCIDKLRLRSKLKDRKVSLERITEDYEVVFTKFSQSIEKNFLRQEAVKEVLKRYNGKVATPGSVKWLFEQKGVVEVEKEQVPDIENFFLESLDFKGEDLKEDDSVITLYTSLDGIEDIKSFISDKNIQASYIKIGWKPISVIETKKKEYKKIIEELEENEDIEDIYTNAKE